MPCAFCKMCLWEAQIPHMYVHGVDLEILKVCDVSSTGVFESVLSQNLEKSGKLGIERGKLRGETAENHKRDPFLTSVFLHSWYSFDSTPPIPKDRVFQKQHQ